MHGSGPPLVIAATFLRHLEYDWKSPVWRHWLAELGRHHTCIRYDERGTGLSDWEVEDLSFEALVSDLETVVEAVGLDRFSLLGMSQGGPVAIAYAARHPEQVSRLILYGTYARGILERNPSTSDKEAAELNISTIRIGWASDDPGYQRLFTAGLMPEANLEQIKWFDNLMRISTSAENAARLYHEFYRIDVRNQATRVKAPTLIMHPRHDVSVPFEEGRLLAKLIPRARFSSLQSRNHLLAADEPAWEEFVRIFRQFMGVEESADEAGVPRVSKQVLAEPEDSIHLDRTVGSPVFAAVLFNDIVESTVQQRTHGDEQWLRLMADFNKAMSHLALEHGGRVVKSTGDGVLAVFPTPGNALRSARAMLDASDTLGLKIREGVHAGEVYETNGDLLGTVVTIASRVADQADAGEILTTPVVEGLVEGSDLAFAEKGEFDLKGVGTRRLLRLVP